MDIGNFFNPNTTQGVLTQDAAGVASKSTGNQFANIGFNLAAGAATGGPVGLAVAGVGSLAGIIKSVGGHPGPGKIYQKDCEAAIPYARQKGVNVRWDGHAWTMTGHCVVTGLDAWNVQLALMKAKNDPRICKNLIPTESGICPVVCSKSSPPTPKGVSTQCRMPNAAGKISGKSGAPSCLTQPGNCAAVKPDTGQYIPTKHNSAPSLDEISHINAVLKQGATFSELSRDQQYLLASDRATQAAGKIGSALGVSSIFGTGDNKALLYVVIGGVALLSLVAALKHG